MGGRPTKQGISFFALDTEFDDDLQLLITETGAAGLGIIITIWQAIYKSNGYFIEYDEKLPLKIKQKCFADVETITGVIQNAINFSILDAGMFSDYNILTSRGIQKRYFAAAKSKKQIEIFPEFLLIDVSDINNGIDISINGFNTPINLLKEKEEEKEKEKEEKDITQDLFSWASLKEKYLPEYVSFTKWFLLKQKEQFPNYIKEEISPRYSRVKDSIDVLDKLCRIDKFDFEKEVSPILKKAIDDPFWAKQILSLASLRNKSKNGEIKFVNLMNTISSKSKKPSRSKITTGFMNDEEPNYSS